LLNEHPHKGNSLLAHPEADMNENLEQRITASPHPLTDTPGFSEKAEAFDQRVSPAVLLVARLGALVTGFVGLFGGLAGLDRMAAKESSLYLIAAALAIGALLFSGRRK
jgi:hypothetical protein